jgi:hypothetical protein
MIRCSLHFFIWNHIVNEIQIWISQIWNSNFVNDLKWKTPNTKVVDLRKLRNFVVDKFLIWIRLVPQKTDLHSVLYSMSRTKTAYRCIWVCGVVAEEVSREVEVTGSNHGNRGASRLYAKKCADGWVAGQWVLSYIKKLLPFIFGF